MAALLASWDAANGLTVQQPSPTPTVDWETITPAIAQGLLDHHNTHNRPLNRVRVTSLAADMTAGRWAVNGETIKVATDGTLLDGQHRLAAIVLSGVAVRILVVRNVAPDAQDTMDTGGKRSFGNQLSLHGEANASQLAATVRTVWVWLHYADRFAAGTATRPPTSTELLEVLRANPELRDDMPLVRRLGTAANMPGQVAGLCVWLLRNVNADDATAFFTALETGVGLQADSPIYLLREHLLRRPVAGDRMAIRALAALTIKAWNKWRRGEPCTALRWVQGGAHPESFPVPV